MNNVFEKYDIEEPIQVGDLISYWPETTKVTRTRLHSWRDLDKNKVLGICTAIKGNGIVVITNGIADVNVTGIVCLGDKLAMSDIAGVAKAIKYDQDETKFRYRHIGKVIGLYNSYNVVKVLLDIE